MAAGKVESAEAAQADRELVLVRVFDAPRDLVWRAWTEPARIAQWLGPRGFTGNVEKFEARVGGKYRFHIRSADGRDMWMQGVNREVEPPERLVYTFAWADQEGRPTGVETLVTVILDEIERGKTRLTFRQGRFESVSARDAHREGWTSTFDRLEETLRAA
ncbi:MAG TPA: SRPBCC domain-containing protein [Candidatus Binataceae bacterium]|jgi:uncharacterized protein YndB with AHSA1/START domain|nr:SRPBCC domain-containing protein [Candidatus Binataceae bacterium]